MNKLATERRGHHITYQLQYRKCKRDCRCNNGAGHGPYMYGYYRENGRLKSFYVGNPDVKQTSSLHAVLMQLQTLNAALRLTRTGVAIWCPGKCVPRFIRSTIKQHADVIAAMIRVGRIEVCPSAKLHKCEWHFSGPAEWTVDSATCAICQRLASINETGVHKQRGKVS